MNSTRSSTRRNIDQLFHALSDLIRNTRSTKGSSSGDVTRPHYKMNLDELLLKIGETNEDSDDNKFVDELVARLTNVIEHDKQGTNSLQDKFEKFEKNDSNKDDVTSKANKDNDTGTDILSITLLICSLVFTFLVITYYFANSITFMQMMGSIVAIWGIWKCSTELFEMINVPTTTIQTDSITEGNLYNYAKTLSESTDDPTAENVKRFMVEYVRSSNNKENGTVVSGQEIDYYFDKQRIFMLKSENTGLNNTTFLERFEKLYEFLKDEPVARKLISEHGMEIELYDTIRNDLKAYAEKKEVMDLYSGALSILEKSNLLNSDSNAYNDLFYDRNETNTETESKFKRILGDLKTLLGNLSEDTPPTEIKTLFDDIIKLNTLLQILNYFDLPEYGILKEILYPGIPELARVLKQTDRYNIQDERVTLDKFKNILNISYDDGNGDIVNLYNETMKAVNDKGETTKKVLHAYSKFIAKCKSETILKNDLLNTRVYKQEKLIIKNVLFGIFKYSSINRNDTMQYIKKSIYDDNNAIPKPDLFWTNVRKVLDIVFDDLDVKRHNEILLQKHHSEEKSQYISYDDFADKMKTYDEAAAKDTYETISDINVRLEQLILNKGNEDSQNDKHSESYTSNRKIKIFRIGIDFYIASSTFFIVDYLIKTFFSEYDDDGNRIKTPNFMLRDDGFGGVKVRGSTDLAESVKSLVESSTTFMNDTRTSLNPFSKDDSALRKFLENVRKLKVLEQNKGNNNLDELISRLYNSLSDVSSAIKKIEKLQTKKAIEPDEKDSIPEGVNDRTINDLIKQLNKVEKLIVEIEKYGEDDKLFDFSFDTETNVKFRYDNFIMISEIEKIQNIQNYEQIIKLAMMESGTSFSSLASKFNKFINKRDKDGTGTTKFEQTVGRLVNVSIVLSTWILSVVLLFTYWMKLDGNQTYNKMIKNNNTVDLQTSVLKMKIQAREFYKVKVRFGESIGNKADAIIKRYYEAMKESLNIHDKCNFTKSASTDVPFPMTEVIIGLALLGLCFSIIMTNNFLNNPFAAANKLKRIQTTMAFEKEFVRTDDAKLEGYEMIRIINEEKRAYLGQVLQDYKMTIGKYQMSISNYEAKLEEYNENNRNLEQNLKNVEESLNIQKTRLNNLSDDNIREERIAKQISELQIEREKLQQKLNKQFELEDVDGTKIALQGAEDMVNEVSNELKTTSEEIKKYKKLSKNRRSITLFAADDSIKGVKNQGLEVIAEDVKGTLMALKDSRASMNKDNVNPDAIYEMLKGLDDHVDTINEYVKTASNSNQTGGANAKGVDVDENENTEGDFSSLDTTNSQLQREVVAPNLSQTEMQKKYQKQEEKEKLLRELQQIDSELVDKNDYKALTTASVAFSILVMSIYLSYTILNNTMRYKSQLFNGKMFGMSLCTN